MRSPAILIVAAMLLAACETAPKKAETPQPPPSPAATETVTAEPRGEPPKPVVAPPAPTPRPPSVAEKREAQDAALRAAVLLDEGKEPEARRELERAAQLDPKNALAGTLRFSITADPVGALGTKSFRYTVKSGDRLSKLSEQYLKDQYKFYLLARYNNLPSPRLQAGQVIRIPGTGPALVPAPPPPVTRIEDLTKTKPAAPREADIAYQEGVRKLQAGNKEAAYDLLARAARLDPKYRADAERLRAELVAVHDRRAREAYKRQQLELSVKEWTRVLELDPTNEIALLERQRALDLQDHLSKWN